MHRTFDGGPQRDTPRPLPGDHDGPRRIHAARPADAKPLSLDEYWMPFTPNRDFKADPKMVVRAEGMYYWNDRGEKIIDASSGLFCVAAGHGRKEIADAVGRQLASSISSRRSCARHPKQFELATRVAELTPGDLNRIFFATPAPKRSTRAMKIALAYHQARGQGGRTMFISRERAYHGVNFGGVALSGIVNNRRKFGPGAARRRAHAPHAAQGKFFHAAAKASTAPSSPTTSRASSICTAPRTSPPASSSRSPARPAASCRRRAI